MVNKSLAQISADSKLNDTQVLKLRTSILNQFGPFSGDIRWIVRMTFNPISPMNTDVVSCGAEFIYAYGDNDFITSAKRIGLNTESKNLVCLDVDAATFSSWKSGSAQCFSADSYRIHVEALVLSDDETVNKDLARIVLTDAFRRISKKANELDLFIGDGIIA